MLQINDKIAIEDDYIRLTYVRSAGPGGQNVNKLNTKAQLVFNLCACPTLTASVKKRLARLAGKRMTNAGILIIKSDRFRHQQRNRQECLNRLRLLIRKALITPKKRRPTTPTPASKRRRRAEKQRRSQTKSLRTRVNLSED